MYLVRRTTTGERRVYKTDDGARSYMWEWNGANRFSENKACRLFGEGYSAIASTIARADASIDEHINNIKGWDTDALR